MLFLNKCSPDCCVWLTSRVLKKLILTIFASAFIVYVGERLFHCLCRGETIQRLFSARFVDGTVEVLFSHIFTS